MSILVIVFIFIVSYRPSVSQLVYIRFCFQVSIPFLLIIFIIDVFCLSRSCFFSFAEIYVLSSYICNVYHIYPSDSFFAQYSSDQYLNFLKHLAMFCYLCFWLRLLFYFFSVPCQSFPLLSPFIVLPHVDLNCILS